MPWLAGVCAVVALLTLSGYAFFFANGQLTVFWPAAGVSLAAILLGGVKYSPAIFLGVFAGLIGTGESPEAAAMIALGNTFEPLLGAWLLTGSDRFDASISTSRDFFRLCFLAGALSPPLFAFLGAGVLVHTGQIEGDHLWQVFGHVWMGDTLGIVVMAPLLLVWRSLPERRESWSGLEAAFLVGLTFLLGQVIFFDWFSDVFGSVNHGYWMYLIITWAAVRFGRHGVLLIMLLATWQPLIGMAGDIWFFGTLPGRVQLINFWAHTMILATVGMSLATILFERGQATDWLRKLSLAVQQSPSSVVITDLGGNIEYVNPAFTSVSGYSEAEALGQNPRLLKSSCTPPETYEELWSTLVAGNTWHGEFTNRRKDGTEYLETATISPMRQENGRITHYVAVKSNITELHQVIANLKSSDERFRLAKESAGLGIFDRDVASQVIQCDERMREIWGFGPDDPVTLDAFMGGLHPDDHASTKDAISRATDPEGNGEYHAEYRVINRADHRLHYVVANGKAFFENGRAVRMIGTVKDISEQKLLELEMQSRRTEMEQLVKQQTAAQTVAAIAHELNQPLVSISMYSEAAMRMLRSGSQNPEKLENALQGAVAQSIRAGEKLHELLNFLQQGKVELEPMALNEVVRDAIAITDGIGYGGFQVRVDMAPGQPSVQANRLQVQKVLVNLLSNSVEAMRNAGLQTAAITISLRTIMENGVVQVTVQDGGPGLDAEMARRAFEPFFSAKEKGIGLGLAISRTLIEAHGGRLWTEAGTGTGGVFHFTLPIAEST